MGIQIKGSNDTISAADGSMVLEGSALVFDNENITGISTMGTGHITGTATIDDDLKVGISTLFVDNSTGKTGLGTNVPSSRLQVCGKSTLHGYSEASIEWGDTSNLGALSFTATAGNPIVRANTGKDLVFQTNGGNTRFVIDSDGKVGISSGTINQEGNALLIRGPSTYNTRYGHIMLTGDGATVGEGPQIVFSESGSGSNNAGAYIGHVRQGSNSIGDLVFGTRNTTGDANTVPTERLRIKADGRTVISSDISTVNVPLVEIYNTAAQAQEGACLKLRSGRGSGVKDTAIFGIHDDNDREFFRIQNDGVVGVNTTTFNTGSKLEVSSEGAYGIISRSQNGNGGYHVFTGQSSDGTNTSYISHNGRGYFEDGVQFDSSGESLDSYEEGTWTPVPENLTNTPTYHNQSGIYTKIGNLVTVVGFIQFNVAPTFSSNDSELRVTGLPFTANGSGYMNTVGNVTFQSLNWSGSTYNDYGAEGNLVCGVVENTKNVFKVNPAGNNLIRGTLRREAFEGGGIITWSMTYKTNS